MTAIRQSTTTTSNAIKAVERYVFIRLQPEYRSHRQDVARHVQLILAEIPQIIDYRVGVPADDHAGAAWDVSIVAGFASIGDIEGYRLHPSHCALVDEYLQPRMQVIKAWNFQLTTM